MKFESTYFCDELELELLLKGNIFPYDARTYWQPPDGGYCEEIFVYLYKKEGKDIELEITDYFSEKKLEQLAEYLYQKYEDHLYLCNSKVEED